MVEIVWEFVVAGDKQAEFERQYGTEGIWVDLFRRDTNYLGTSLLRDRETAGQYMTIDRWRDWGAYEAFRLKYADEYTRIDARMEHLTQSEKKVGVFDTV